MKLPKELLVYQCDQVDGKPVYAVAQTLDEIPEDHSGEKIGTYRREEVSTFYVTRGTR